MTFFAYQGVLACPSAAGSQSYTDAGFQPKAILFWSHVWNTSGDVGSAGAAFSFCWSTSPPGAAMQLAANNNVTTTNTAFGMMTNGTSFSGMTPAGTAVRCAASVTAFLSNGFTLNWTSFTSGVIVHYLALGGTDLSVAGGAITPRTTAGTQSVTGLSFQPKLVLFVSSIATSATTTTSVGFGAAASPTARWALSYSAAAGQTMAASCLASCVQDTTKCITQLAAGGVTTNFEQVDLSSMNSDGFTLNWTTASATAHGIVYIAFGGAATFSCGSFTKQANTTQTSQAVNAGLSVAPAAYLLAASLATSNTASTAGWIGSIGGTDGVRANSMCWENRAATVATNSRSYTDPGGTGNSVLRLRLVPTSGSVPAATQIELDHTSMNADGFTVALTTNVTASAIVFPYVTFGPPAISMPNTALTGPADAFAA